MQCADPQFGSIPRHLGMAPAGPREFATVPADSRKRIKVVPTQNDSWAARAVGGNCNDLVDRFTALLVPFTNANDGLSIRCDATICVTQARRRGRIRCDRQRHGACILPIQTLIFEIGKEDGAIVNEICAATILVDTTARIEGLWYGISR